MKKNIFSIPRSAHSLFMRKELSRYGKGQSGAIQKRG